MDLNVVSMGPIKVFVNVVTGNQVTTFQEQYSRGEGTLILRPSLRQARFLHLTVADAAIGDLHTDLESQAGVTGTQLLEKNFCVVPKEYKVGDCISSESEVYLVIPTNAHQKRAEKKERRRKKRGYEETSELQENDSPLSNQKRSSEPPQKRGKAHTRTVSTPSSSPRRKANLKSPATINGTGAKRSPQELSKMSDTSKPIMGKDLSSPPSAEKNSDLARVQEGSQSETNDHAFRSQVASQGRTFSVALNKSTEIDRDEGEMESSPSLHSSESDSDIEESERARRRKAVPAPRSVSATPTASASASPLPSIAAENPPNVEKKAEELAIGTKELSSRLAKNEGEELTSNSLKGLARLQELSIPDVHETVHARAASSASKKESDVESAESSSSDSGTSDSSSSEDDDTTPNERAGSAGKSALRNLLKR